ncbi:hypothetical protein HDU99_002284, partial [Rhizoclosmatium hyalinum]
PPKTKLLIARHSSEPRLLLTACPNKLAPAEIVSETIASIYYLFNQAQCHNERLIYALCGHVFSPSAPPPHGGPRLKPGYINYGGQTPKDLLEYMVASSYEMYWYCKDKKVLEFIVISVNKVLAMQFRGQKDVIDERLLQGLKRAGHIDWHGAAIIPEYLSHCPPDQVASGAHVVEFTPQRRLVLEEQNQGATWGVTPSTKAQARKRGSMSQSYYETQGSGSRSRTQNNNSHR